jgi:hypothetical protein
MVSLEQIEDEVLYFIDHMEPKDWVIVLAALIVFGLVCMKGIGSRAKN